MKTKEEKQNDSLIEKYLGIAELISPEGRSLKDVFYLIVKDARELGFLEGFKQSSSDINKLVKEYVKKRI